MKQFKILLTLCYLTAPWMGQAQIVFNSYPSRIVGQPILQQTAPTVVGLNLVEGRELNSPQSLAVDTSSSPNILYVADTNNNRVLAWKNAAAFNRGDTADKVIGQRDLMGVLQKGPGSDLSTGLTLPIAVAVDKAGNLYVADGGNNRIVRYPAPLAQTGQLLAIDLVIGQPDRASRLSNQNLPNPTEKTLFYSSGSTFRAGLTFDAQGNLWASDPGNNRVLRYPVASLTPGNDGLAADIVVGQADFVTRLLPPNAARNGKNFLSHPAGLAFDPQGRLYVTDDQNRVVVYTPPIGSGAIAARLMGVIPPTTAVPNPPTLNENTLGSVVPPQGVFFVGNNPFVVDTGNARILKYDPFDQWPAESTLFSPKATAVIGQADFLTNKSNQGQPQPSETSLSGPVSPRSVFETNGVVAGAFAGNDLYVADAGNNRVLVFPQQSGGTFRAATRLLGQIDFKYNAPNLIEGREFFFQQAGAALVVDNASNPPHLYVSDPGNNRILGFRDFRKVTAGSTADLVIGQPDFFTAMVNYPKADINQPNDQGLASPEGLALDANGDLWVADSGNGRVLRFPRPFDQPAGSGPEHANLVIGQTSYFAKVTDASSQTMRTPLGIAFSASGHLLVSDTAFNRILFFRKPSGGDFTSGQIASGVIGQPDFGPPTAMSLSGPRLIAIDPDDRLYVADSGNNRVAVYRNVTTSGNDPAPSFSLTGLNNPFGVVVDSISTEIWVADTNGNRVLRYPRFDTLVLNSMPTVTIPSTAPLAIGLDPFGNPLVAESVNRIAFYYPSIDSTSSAGGVPNRFSGNAASYLQRFAPGMIATIFSYQNTHFGLDTAQASTVPLPTTLGDVQVFVNGTAAPLYYASPGQINFQVPYGVPVGSLVEFQVARGTTGQIVASGLFRIEPVSPGLFTADASGSGQLLAINVADNTINSALHPAKAGTYISLFGTGAGVVAGAPPDGMPNPNQPVPTDELPQVFINATQVPAADIQYSGLAPGFIGLWQINVKVPATVPTSAIPVPVAVVFKGINSQLDQVGNRRTTTIRTTP